MKQIPNDTTPNEQSQLPRFRTPASIALQSTVATAEGERSAPAPPTHTHRARKPRLHTARRVLATSCAASPPASLETDIIALFVDLMRCFGAPKSLGAIYGLLFVSEKPIPFESIATRLQLSTGSVSQGLRLLKELGAATVVFVPGDRRDHYTAETRLRQLAAGFLRRRVDAEFVNAGERLARVVDQFSSSNEIKENATHQFLAERVATLARWQQQARQLLPVALQALSGDDVSKRLEVSS